MHQHGWLLPVHVFARLQGVRKAKLLRGSRDTANIHTHTVSRDNVWGVGGTRNTKATRTNLYFCSCRDVLTRSTQNLQPQPNSGHPDSRVDHQHQAGGRKTRTTLLGFYRLKSVTYELICLYGLFLPNSALSCYHVVIGRIYTLRSVSVAIF